MALKTTIKVNGVTNLHEARYCAGMGVDMIGLPIGEGMEGTIGPTIFQEIAGWLSGVQYVGELEDLNKTAIHEYDLGYLETNDPDTLDELQRFGTDCILRCDIDIITQKESIESYLNLYQDQATYFLIESAGEMTDAYFTQLQALADTYPLLVGFGITANNVNYIIEGIKPKGLALGGSKEIKTGLNDFDELADILEQLDTDEYS